MSRQTQGGDVPPQSKSYYIRQVILVTHNANLVVNADAEQVVVAENANGVLKYSSGSLEAKVTNKAVRRILEGGDEAFLKRELRYNLK